MRIGQAVPKSSGGSQQGQVIKGTVCVILVTLHANIAVPDLQRYRV